LKLAYEELKKHKDFEESEDDMNERSKKWKKICGGGGNIVK
jgi:translation initiation factor 1 (eIF-1/SUI1)